MIDLELLYRRNTVVKIDSNCNKIVFFYAGYKRYLITIKYCFQIQKRILKVTLNSQGYLFSRATNILIENCITHEIVVNYWLINHYVK